MHIQFDLKTMIDYQKSYIYKLANCVDDQIYIGGALGPPAARFHAHKQKAKRQIYAAFNPYKHLNPIGWDKIRIIVLEKFPCNSKIELTERIQYWITKLNPTLNVM